MKNIKSIIRLNCNEEIDVKYFSKDGSITDTTLDYSELLEYINEIEDKNERLNSIIKEVREYIERETKELYSRNKSCKYLGEIMQLENVLEILDKVGEE